MRKTLLLPLAVALGFSASAMAQTNKADVPAQTITTASEVVAVQKHQTIELSISEISMVVQGNISADQLAKNLVADSKYFQSKNLKRVTLTSVNNEQSFKIPGYVFNALAAENEESQSALVANLTEELEAWLN